MTGSLHLENKWQRRYIMKKIETSIETLVEDIKEFYDEKIWHYVTVNALDLGDGLEIQYFFTRYESMDECVCYFVKIDYEQEIPSVIGIIPSAYLGEGEVVDMFGAKIEGVNKGTFLDPDSIQTPLRREK